jgi:RNA polymerase sigma factor (sigma-70 family)
MVLRVCCQILTQIQDAEDAYQATFLVLARTPSAVRKPQAVGSWLHGVAYRVAQQARVAVARRWMHEQRGTAMVQKDPFGQLTWQELQEGLHAELSRLTDSYRAPLVLCYLEGKTQDEAARQLGWSLGTFRRRLRCARKLLRQRLNRRGITLSAALLATGLPEQTAVASASRFFTTATLREIAKGSRSMPVSSEVWILADGVIQSMTAARLKSLMFLIMAICAVAAGTGLLADYQQKVRREDDKQAKSSSDQKASQPLQNNASVSTRVDRQGDPLPEGGLARIGTLRFRHGHTVSAIAFSPDGKTLATASWDREVRLWERATGKLLKIMTGHAGWVTCIAFARDGVTLASGGEDGSIKLWSASTGEQLRNLSAHRGWVKALAFAHHGKTFVSGGADGTLQLWETSSGKAILRISGHQGEVRSVAFSADDQQVASASNDGTIRIWEATTGQESKVLSGHKGPVAAIAFTPAGDALISGGEDSTIRLWDLKTNMELRQLRGHKLPLVALSLSSDGNTLATIASRLYGAAVEVRLWDLQTSKVLQDLPGHYNTAFCLELSPDGKTLATGAADNTVRLWDCTTGRELGPDDGHRAPVIGVAFSPDGKLLASASDDGTVRLWEPKNQKEIRRLGSHEGMVQDIAFSPDGKVLASAGRDGAIRLWAVGTGKELQHWTRPVWFHAVAFSPDGKYIAAGSGNVDNSWQPPGEVWVWEVASGKQLHCVKGHQLAVRCLAFSPVGDLLATGSNDRSVAVWDVARGVLIRRLTEPQGEIESVVFSNDALVLAAGGRDHKVRFWDAPTGRLLREMSLPNEVYAWKCCSLGFSTDGRTLAVGSWQNLRLYEVATRKERRALPGHMADIRCVAFAPDGRKLASAGGDATVMIWDVTGRNSHGSTRQTKLSTAELERAWAALAAEDAVQAANALWTLASLPEQSLPLLSRNVRPVEGPKNSTVRQLIVDLDDNAFSVRERASRELEKLGTSAGQALRQALRNQASPEVRARVGALLEKLPTSTLPPEDLQTLRALEALEVMATPEARKLLSVVARGSPDSWQTQEAKASLERLTKRSALEP